MNPSTFGFRPATKGDFMAFAGAEPDSMFLSVERPENDEQGGIAIFSPSKKTMQVHLVGHASNPMGAVWIEFQGAAALAALGGVEAFIRDGFGCVSEFQMTERGWIVG